MATLNETETWTAGVTQLERTDVIDAGVGGNGKANQQAKDLANRAVWLKARTLANDGSVNVNATPFDLTPYWDKGVVWITTSIASATARAPEPPLGEARVKTFRNSSANDVTISTPLGTSSQVLKAGTVRTYLFLRTDGTHTSVLPIALDLAEVVALLAGTPTIGAGTITGAAISGGTISGAAISGGTCSGAAITGGSIGGCSLSGGVVSGLGISSAVLSGTPNITATSMQASGNARCKVYSDIANVQTTDATVTTIFSWSILDEAVTTETAEVSAVKSDGSVTASYVRRARIKRDGGTVTVGTVNDMFTDEEGGFSACDTTIDASGSSGRVRVTGLAATTIDWGLVSSRMELSHA